MATLAEIRAKLQAASQTQTSSGDSAIYPHWSIADGSTVSVRFLPDADPNNTFFWVERAVIKLPFAGVKGDTASKPCTVQVPCMEMWGETCPILTEVRPWFKDKTLEEMGKRYWKKRSYLFQGFVLDNKIPEDTTPENPIRRFIINTEIFSTIKTALLDPEMEELPTDFVRGIDFRITKTTKGQYANYATSSWARRERALNETELAAIQQHGLFNLKDFLPKKPGETELRIIKEMFEASVDGEAYDPVRWGQYFKPSGYSDYFKPSGSTASAPAQQAAPAAVAQPKPRAQPVVQQALADDVPWEDDGAASTPVAAPAAAAPSTRAQDILAAIRNRPRS